MSFRSKFYSVGGIAGVHWLLNKRIFLWLGFFVVVGIIAGFVTVFNPRITFYNISTGFLDTNLYRVIYPNAGLGILILGRTFSFAIFFALVFAVSLSKWTSWLVFVFSGYQGFSLVINMYWVFAKFGIVSGGVLFLVYVILLLILLCIELCAVVYCLRVCENVRKGGLRGGMRWHDFFSGCLKFLIVIVVFSFVEWIFYWLIISRIVFVV